MAGHTTGSGVAVRYHRRVRWAPAGLLLVAACGRLNFDPFGATGDGQPPGGDGSNVSDGPPPVDALPAACAQAIAVSVNQPITKDSCSTGQNRVDGCAGESLDELVFRFVAPVSGSYTVRTFDQGGANIITTGRVDDPCVANSGCFGLSSTMMTVGQTSYFVVEASTGTCQTVTFSVTMP
jgi:hypothetical protein